MTDIALIQEIAQRAAMIATNAALNGRPLATIGWIPPVSATQDRTGTFVVREWNGSASMTPPWSK